MRQSPVDKILPWAWAFIWFMLPLSMKGTVVSLWLFGILVLYQAIIKKPKISRFQFLQAGLFGLLFMWYSFSFFIDENEAETWKMLERKLVLLFIPLLMLFANQMITGINNWAARGFYLGLIVSGIHMLVVAGVSIFQDADPGFILYHKFTKPYALGAIYYSWYLSIAIIYLIYRKQEPLIQNYRLALLAFFIILLSLSASKLFISLTLPLVFWKFFTGWLPAKNRRIIAAALFVIIIVGLLPFYNRMGELRNTNLDIVKQREFSYDTPFNGITIRLVQWRFAFEILNNEDVWITGVGIGSKQDLLNNHYKKHGVYTGNPDLGDNGYLDYNFHNQYLEILVGSGIPGLLILLIIICFTFFRNRKKLIFPLAVYLVMLLFFTTESVLERQNGIVVFCLILCTFTNRNCDTLNAHGSPVFR